MVRADELAVNIPGEDHHADWNQDIDHPDARLIAAAPDLLAVLEAIVGGIDAHDGAVASIKKARGER
jgi:hypothetical protein